MAHAAVHGASQHSDQSTPELFAPLMDLSPGSQDSPDSKSPLSSFGFLKNLSITQKQTKDGQAPKRRGPKPDSKPALTRRQELNRQAQRTHRERKEMYIKALEQEVLHLKELYGSSTRDRESVMAENQKLKELLAAHGISFDSLMSGNTTQEMPFMSYNGSSSGSISGSYRHESNTSGFSPPPLRSQDSMNSQTPLRQQMAPPSQLPSNRLDYDQIGIDFVLAYDSQGRPFRVAYPSPPPNHLERPCMDHMQYLVVRSHNPQGQPAHHPMERADDAEYEHMCGHALMATCPPASHIMEKPGEPYPHKMPDMSTPDLKKLFQLSSQLPLEGEITPVMAWMMIMQDGRLHDMSAQDFESLKADLGAKVRCYGFGAVLEEFEVRDALSSLFTIKESVPMGQTGISREVAVY